MADKNFESHADVDGVVIEGRIIPGDGVVWRDYSDILKLSCAKNVVVRNCHIYGGVEDCIDMNRYCENVLVENCTIYPHGKYGMTIKGGSRNITLRNVIVDGRGTEVDVDLGNWSDQSMEQTREVLLENVCSSSGSPVRVRVLWAEKPTVIGGNVEIWIVPRIFVWIYRWLRSRNLVP